MPRLKVTARSKSPFGTIDDAQHKFVIKVGTGLKGDTGDRGDRGETGLINGATEVQVHPTTKVMYNGSSIPANTAASKLVGTASGQIPLAQDVASILTGKAIDVTSVKSGAASYKRGWRKIVATFGTGDSTIYVNKGTNAMTLTNVRVKTSGNVVIHPSDTRPPFAYQVTENMNQQRVEIKKLATATGLDGTEIHVYIDEEL